MLASSNRSPLRFSSRRYNGTFEDGLLRQTSTVVSDGSTKQSISRKSSTCLSNTTPTEEIDANLISLVNSKVNHENNETPKISNRPKAKSSSNKSDDFMSLKVGQARYGSKLKLGARRNRVGSDSSEGTKSSISIIDTNYSEYSSEFGKVVPVSAMQNVIAEDIIVKPSRSRLNQVDRHRAMIATKVGGIIKKDTSSKENLKNNAPISDEDKALLRQYEVELEYQKFKELANANRDFAPVPDLDCIRQYELLLSNLITMVLLIEADQRDDREIKNVDPVLARIMVFVAAVATECSTILGITQSVWGSAWAVYTRDMRVSGSASDVLLPKYGEMGLALEHLNNIFAETESIKKGKQSVSQTLDHVNYSRVKDETDALDLMRLDQLDLLRRTFLYIALQAAKYANDFYEPIGSFYIDPQAHMALFDQYKGLVVIKKLLEVVQPKVECMSRIASIYQKDILNKSCSLSFGKGKKGSDRVTEHEMKEYKKILQKLDAKKLTFVEPVPFHNVIFINELEQKFLSAVEISALKMRLQRTVSFDPELSSALRNRSLGSSLMNLLNARVRSGSS